MKYKVLLLITVISALIFANSIHNDFQYDDEFYVTGNYYIRDAGNIPAFFIHPEYLTSVGHRGHYRPLVAVSYAFNYFLGGLSPAGYHIVDLLFHIGTGFLLFLTIQAVLSSPPPILSLQGGAPFFIALASALIFIVHPFNSEVVNYITARSSVMSGFFYMLAFYFWVRFRGEKIEDRSQKIEVRSRKRSYLYLSSLFVFLIGLITKETGITLPIVLFIYDIYFKYFFAGKTNIIRRLSPYLPFVLVVAIPVVIRRIYSGGVIPYFKRDIFTQLYTMIPVLARYLKLLFLPTGLNIAHHVEIYSTPFNIPVIFSALILLLYIIIAVYLYWRGDTGWRLQSFFMIWFFVTLLPIIIFPLNSIMQENRCYISSAGFPIFLGIVLWRLSEKGARLKLAYGLLAVMIILYGTGTVYRNMVWKDGITLWTDALEKSPTELIVYNNLSVLHARGGNYEAVKGILEQGVRLFPGNWPLRYNLGKLYATIGELDSALREYDIASRLEPSEAMIYNNKGSVYLLKGDMDNAIAAFQKAVEKRPGYALAHYNMAKALKKSGRLEDSKRELDIALKYAAMSKDKRLFDDITKEIKGKKEDSAR